MAAAMSASLCAASVASGLAQGAETGGILQCRMRVPSQVAAGQAIPLTFELVSRSYKTLYVLPWNTPLEGWLGRSIRVTGADGADIEYTGPQVKRGAPARRDYKVLLPGKRLRAVVDVTQAYSLGRPGRYEIAFDGTLHDVTTRAPGSSRIPYPLRCPTIAVNVVAGKSPPRSR